MHKWFRRPAVPQVQSVFVQANYAVSPFRLTRSQTLVRHLLSRFQTTNTQEEEQAGRRTLFACAAAALPPVFTSVMLYPAYHPISIVPTFRPYWSRIGDEYLYLLYAFLAMGVAAIALWESVFPDLLDVFVLGISPLPSQLLLRTRLKAILLVFGLVLLCVAAPGSVLLPALAESYFFRQLVAHAVGAGAAGLSAGASFISIQATLELLLGTRRAKQFIPTLQAVGLLILFFLLGETPRLLDDLQRGAPDYRAPVVWFLAIYEQVRGGVDVFPQWTVLAWRGWLTTVISLIVAGLTYSRAYQMRTLFLIESGNATAPSFRAPQMINRLLHRVLVRTPGARSTFHFVAQTAFRVSKLRTTLVIYVGLGLAALLATSMDQPARAVAIACCAVVLGCTGVIQSQFLPRSAWMVEVLPEPQDQNYALGSKLLITLWASLFTISLLLVFTAKSHNMTVESRGLIASLGAALALPSALSRLFLMGTRTFPFTGEQDTTPERFVLIFLRNTVALPCGLLAFGSLALKASSSAVGVWLWMMSMGCLALMTSQKALQRVRILEAVHWRGDT